MSVLLNPTFSVSGSTILLDDCPGFGHCRCAGSFHRLMTVKIKWPNDVYVGANKIAGILTEASVSKKSIDHAVIGVGVNIHQQEFGTLKATSDFTGNRPLPKQRSRHGAHFFSYMEKWFQKLKNRQYGEIILRYHALLFWRNEKAHIQAFKGNQMEGKIKGINDRGQLIVEIGGKESHLQSQRVNFHQIIRAKTRDKLLYFCAKKKTNVKVDYIKLKTSH